MSHTNQPSRLGTICVFCGSSKGTNPQYAQGTRNLAAAMIPRKLSLVYGGGGIGLMGLLAQCLHGKVPKVTGVIPERLYRMIDQIEHHEDELLIVQDMHERKSVMYQCADGFIALPGGTGTLEELMEALTWLHLGYHGKPVALLDIAGFYSHLVLFLRHCVGEGFLKQELLDALIIDSDPERLLDTMSQWKADLPGKTVS